MKELYYDNYYTAEENLFDATVGAFFSHHDPATRGLCWYITASSTCLPTATCQIRIPMSSMKGSDNKIY